MKDDDPIFSQKEKDQAASEVRRLDYALKRDHILVEYNQAIVKRFSLKEKNIIKCSRCGKEFPAGNVTEEKICPDCLNKDAVKE
jgi:DNA-directed RNA polymerase subunit RPC12/RpoP